MDRAPGKARRLNSSQIFTRDQLIDSIWSIDPWNIPMTPSYVPNQPYGYSSAEQAQRQLQSALSQLQAFTPGQVMTAGLLGQYTPYHPYVAPSPMSSAAKVVPNVVYSPPPVMKPRYSWRYWLAVVQLAVISIWPAWAQDLANSTVWHRIWTHDWSQSPGLLATAAVLIISGFFWVDFILVRQLIRHR